MILLSYLDPRPVILPVPSTDPRIDSEVSVRVPYLDGDSSAWDGWPLKTGLASCEIFLVHLLFGGLVCIKLLHSRHFPIAPPHASIGNAEKTRAIQKGVSIDKGGFKHPMALPYLSMVSRLISRIGNIYGLYSRPHHGLFILQFRCNGTSHTTGSRIRTVRASTEIYSFDRLRLRLVKSGDNLFSDH